MAIPAILQKVQALGHTTFITGQYNLNIIGVRTADMTPNTFNDWLYVVYKDETNNWVELRFQITTDPGLYYLNNPMSVRGTAILKAGQYRGSHKLGQHRGQYDALVQRRKVTVYRDTNKDDEYDMDPESEISGYFGINIHRANSRRESTQVDRWSAGCQVFSDPNEFGMFIDLCKRAAQVWGPSFTYTLIEE